MSGVRRGRRGAAGRGARACPHPAAISLWLSAALPRHLLRVLLPLLTVFHLERAEDAARRAGDTGGDGDEPVGTPAGGRDGPLRLTGLESGGMPQTWREEHTGTLSWREEPSQGVPGTPPCIPHPDRLGLCPRHPTKLRSRTVGEG